MGRSFSAFEVADFSVEFSVGKHNPFMWLGELEPPQWTPNELFIEALEHVY